MPDRLSVLVTGATGHQGGALARLLLSKGHHVRALTRKPDSPAAGRLKARGAEIVVGYMEDSVAITRAVKAMDAVFASPLPSSGERKRKSAKVSRLPTQPRMRG